MTDEGKYTIEHVNQNDIDIGLGKDGDEIKRYSR